MLQILQQSISIIPRRAHKMSRYSSNSCKIIQASTRPIQFHELHLPRNSITPNDRDRQDGELFFNTLRVMPFYNRAVCVLRMQWMELLAKPPFLRCRGGEVKPAIHEGFGGTRCGRRTLIYRPLWRNTRVGLPEENAKVIVI